jgi:hypothetical protein
MEARTVKKLPPAAAHHDAVRLLSCNRIEQELQPGKTGVFSRRQTCQGKSQSPVVWMAG